MNCSVITELQKMKNVAEVVYAVRVQRRKASDRLGIAWRRDYNTNDVRVKSVTAGLIDEWNKANPDFKVRIGDTLLEVNGSPGHDAKECACKLASDLDLHFLFRRG